MDRVLQNAPATITETFDADPGTTTVAVVNDAGTSVASGAATGTGSSRSFPLTAVHTATLDRLVLTWTTQNLGTQRTVVEVVGGFLFSLAELRAFSLGGAKTVGSTFSDDQLRDMRTTVEDTLEHACGVAFTPRYSMFTAGRERWPLRLKPFLRAIRRVSVGGTAYTADQLTALGFDEQGFVYSGGYGTGYSAWVDGEPRYPTIGGIAVGFEHGMDEPPPRIRKAALLLAKTWLVSGPVDDRVTTMSSPDTGITAALAVPGRGGSVVGVPEVDQVISEYRMPAVA